MRAWRVHELAPPGTPLEPGLRLDADAPEPRPGPGQVLVRVGAAALNFPDVLLARGIYQMRPPLPFSPGIELCGGVVEVGDGVDPAYVGRRVLGMPELPWGALAELAVMDAGLLHDVPAGLDDAGAAGFYVAYQTAWFALHRRAGLRAGETLLVHAAAGGVGSAAVQLGRAAGARVVAVVGGAQKAKLAEHLGADVVVDRRVQDFVAVVKQVTGGRGADVVFDPVGGDTFDASTKCIASEGRLVVIGFAGGRIASAPTNHMLLKNYGVLGLHWGAYRVSDPALVHQVHATLCGLVADRAISPVVSERLAMEEAAAGLGRLERGETVGRLVVELG